MRGLAKIIVFGSAAGIVLGVVAHNLAHQHEKVRAPIGPRVESTEESDAITKEEIDKIIADLKKNKTRASPRDGGAQDPPPKPPKCKLCNDTGSFPRRVQVLYKAGDKFVVGWDWADTKCIFGCKRGTKASSSPSVNSE